MLCSCQFVGHIRRSIKFQQLHLKVNYISTGLVLEPDRQGKPLVLVAERAVRSKQNITVAYPGV